MKYTITLFTFSNFEREFVIDTTTLIKEAHSVITFNNNKY